MSVKQGDLVDLLVEMVRENEVLMVTQGGLVWSFIECLLYTLSIISGIYYFVENLIFELKTKDLNEIDLKIDL